VVQVFIIIIDYVKSNYNISLIDFNPIWIDYI